MNLGSTNLILVSKTIKLNFKSTLSLYSLYYAEACNELVESIYASLRPGNTASFEEMSQRWRAVGNTVFKFSKLFAVLTLITRGSNVLEQKLLSAIAITDVHSCTHSLTFFEKDNDRNFEKDNNTSNT